MTLAIRLLCLAIALFVCPTSGRSQQPCPPNPVNRFQGLGLFNTEIGGPVEFPNFRTTQGNHAGDGLWKVYPKELFVRPRRDDNFITGITIPWKVHNYTGSQQCAGFSGFELRAAVRNAAGHLVPDMASPALLSRTVGLMTFPADQYWLIRANVLPYYFFRVPSMDIAIVLKPEAGRNATQNDMYTAFRSTHERYSRAPQPSFSGRINGATGQIELLMPPVVSEACELQIELCFGEAVARVSATSSTSVPVGPGELATGVGAYYNDLATTGGQLRWYFEFDGWDAQFLLGIPLLSRYRLPAPLSLAGLPCPIDFDVSDPLTSVLLGAWGPLTLQWRSPYSSFSNAIGVTRWISIPQDLALRGASFNVGCLLYEIPTNSFRLMTNLVSVSLN